MKKCLPLIISLIYSTATSSVPFWIESNKSIEARLFWARNNAKIQVCSIFSASEKNVQNIVNNTHSGNIANYIEDDGIEWTESAVEQRLGAAPSSKLNAEGGTGIITLSLPASSPYTKSLDGCKFQSTPIMGSSSIVDWVRTADCPMDNNSVNRLLHNLSTSTDTLVYCDDSWWFTVDYNLIP